MQVINEELRRRHYVHAKALGIEDVLKETEAWATSMEDVMRRIPGIPIGIRRFHELPLQQSRIAIDFLIDCWVKNHEFRSALIAGN